MRLIDILLVEDNPDHAILTMAVLEDNNVANRVHLVKDGEEALDFIYRRGKYGEVGSAPRPGFILLDIRLPKIDGLEVLSRIKNDPEHRAIPVIMLTTSSQDEEIMAAYAEGANGYVTKPVDFTEFASKVSIIGLYWGLTNSLSGA